MITKARWGVWETNSSTMNQIAIHLNGNDVVFEKNISIDYDIDVMTDKTYFGFQDKVKILYMIIEEIEYEAETSDRYIPEGFLDYDMRWEHHTFRQALFDVLNKHKINYAVHKDHNKQRECDMFGLSGVKDMTWLFKDEEMLEAFLFDPKSGFTFGEENDWPNNNNVGYDTNTETKYDSDSPIYHITLI